MKLANKPCYPQTYYGIKDLPPGLTSEQVNDYLRPDGLTYREWLAGQLASNPEMRVNDYDHAGNYLRLNYKATAQRINLQADAIIKELEKAEK